MADIVSSTTSNFFNMHVPILNLFQNDFHLRSLIGVSFCLLESLTKLVCEQFEKRMDDNYLTVRERIALTLCKLKLNLSFSALSTLFCIDRHTCCVYFLQMLPLLSSVLKCSVYWPTKEEVKQSLPVYLQNLNYIRVVIDCFHIAVCALRCFECQFIGSKWSNQITIKVLLGLAPSGFITFISKVYGGNTPEEKIFSESKVWSLIDPYMD